VGFGVWGLGFRVWGVGLGFGLGVCLLHGHVLERREHRDVHPDQKRHRSAHVVQHLSFGFRVSGLGFGFRISVSDFSY